ncbi:sensor histidine kinase [Actinomadura viridis]|uniref:sensor histidine kinase n=1 Tax=Actinomadura viridis TaxID=58110 RepID=UPI0036A492F5
MTLKAGAVAALVSLGVTALVLAGVRGHSIDSREERTGEAALHVIHLIRQDRLPARLPGDDVRHLQVLDEQGAVVAATPRVRDRPRIAEFLPAAERAFDRRVLCRPAGLDGCLRVVAFRVYRPEGDWLVYAAHPVVPWYVSVELAAFMIMLSLLVSLLAAMRTWRAVNATLAPVDAIRAELAEITATRSGRRVPVPESRDEIRLLAETANATLDRLDAALERQRRFTAEASHDLRSPITAARTQLEEALLHPGDTDWPRVGRSVLDSLERLQAIVTDLLELARLDAGVQPEAKGRGVEEVDLAALVSAELERSPRGCKRVVPQLQYGVRVRGDRLRLARLLTNLLDNAERHAAEQITVTVRAEGDTAIMEVADDGEGIPAADRELVFQRFARLKAARDRDMDGTGLGLPIARQIAKSHQGTLTIEDSRKGARFVLRIPRRP